MKNRRKDYTGINKICLFCGQKYNDVPNRRLKYCSDECFRKATTRSQHYQCKFCGSVFITTPSRNTEFCCRTCLFKFYIGRPKSEEFGEKVSLAKLKGSIPSEGKKLRKTAKYLKSRTSVLNRDGFTCQICFNSGFETHHIITIKENPKLSSEVSNLITLCKDCHDKKVSRNEEKWKPYFKEVLEKKV